MAMVMTRLYDIRERSIEVSTQRPTDVRVDASILPWRPGDREREATGILGKAGGAVLVEIDDYRGERDVMLTSGGFLPSRFLFHLTLPEEGKVDPEILEERFRDCLFQAGVLGLGELAIPIVEFSPFVEDFSELVEAVWKACREFLGRERGPRRVLFLVEDRDLRGQYLRHFFGRKQAEERKWSAGDSAPGAIPTPASQTPSEAILRRREGEEKVLSLDVAETDALTGALQSLLVDYSQGRSLDPTLCGLTPPMRQALDRSVSRQGEPSELPTRLRILGSDLVLKLPWELLRLGHGYLGEEHLLTRGTNFLHFQKERRRTSPQPFQVSFRVTGSPDAARRLAEELQSLSERRQLGLSWGKEEGASARLVHCLGRKAAESLLDEMPLSCELVFLELEPGEDWRESSGIATEECARQLVAHGCRRVLAPLAGFRSDRERFAFRTTFYERLLSGASVGDALHYAQRVAMEAFGTHSGWWLYRIFGQTDEILIPARKTAQRESRATQQA